MPYSVPQHIDPNKIFLVNFSELEGRWDPQFYTPKNLGLVRSITKRVKWKRLKELVRFSTETWNQKDFFEEEFPYVEISEIDTSNGDIRNINFIEITKAPSRAKMIVHNGDIIISTTRPTRGAISLVNTKLPILIASTGFSVIREVDENVILKTALFIILRLEMSLLQMGQRSSGGNYPAITQDELGKIIIPVPPLHIQQQIVNDYNAVLSQRKKKLSESKAKLASIDQYLLGELGITLPEDSHEKTFIVNYKDVDGGRLDPFYHQSKYINIEKQISKGTYSPTKLKKLCYAISGVVYSSSDERKEGKAILRANNITLETNELNFDSIRYIDSSIKLSDDLKLHKNDILMCTASGSKEHAGKVAFISEELNYYFGGFMSVIRICNSDINATYLFEYMASRFFKLNLFRNLGGTNINNVNFKMIENFEIPLPPLSKQREIVDHISAIRAEAKALEQEANAILEQAKKKVEEMILG